MARYYRNQTTGQQFIINGDGSATLLTGPRKGTALCCAETVKAVTPKKKDK